MMGIQAQVTRQRHAVVYEQTEECMNDGAVVTRSACECVETGWSTSPHRLICCPLSMLDISGGETTRTMTLCCFLGCESFSTLGASAILFYPCILNIAAPRPLHDSRRRENHQSLST